MKQGSPKVLQRTESRAARRRTMPFRQTLFLLLLGIPLAASAAITPSPPTVTLFPTQASGPITLTLTFPAATSTGSDEITFIGLPVSTTTIPSPVTFSFVRTGTSATTTFQVQTGARTPPGTYTVNMRTRFSRVNAGGGAFSLTVRNPGITAAATPNPVSLTRGGPTQAVTVSTMPDPGLRAPTITYQFTGFPAFINTGGAQSTSGGFPPVTFSFSAAADASPGTYSGFLEATYTDNSGAPAGRRFPFSVVVLQPDITVSFSRPSVSLCSGGAPVANSVTLSPVNGYRGAPELSFGAPAGITVNPASITSPPLPPAQTVPFTIQAAVGIPPGPRTVTLAVEDRVAGIIKTATLSVNVEPPDFTPSASPTTLTLAPGGPAQPLSVSLTPDDCLTANVTVSPSGAPAGLDFRPPSLALSPPYSPRTFSVSATSSVRPGTYPVTLSYAAAGGPTKTRSVSIVVTAAPPPDFALTVAPPSLTLPPGGSGSLSVSATGINGFTGMVSVTAPTVGGVTFDPSIFSIPAGGSRMVSVSVATGALPGTSAVEFTGTATGISGSRTALFSLTIAAGPDFTLSVSPPFLSLMRGETASLTVFAAGLNGFSDAIAISAPSLPGVTFDPSSFSISPGGSQTVSVTIADGAESGTLAGAFTGTAAGVVGVRSAAFSLTIPAAGQAPEIDTLVPPGTTPGVADLVVRVGGSNFQPGGRIEAAIGTAGILVKETTVLSATLADVRLSIRADVPAGPIPLVFVNPDGARSAGDDLLLIHPTSSLGAPLGVTQAAIIFPARGTLIAAGEAVYPRALLATTGTGTIIASWKIDGFPFDRVTATISGGHPTEVRAHVPIPTLRPGDHRLELEIETPRLAESPFVDVIFTAERASRLTLLAPREGAVIGPRLPRFRWSLVPWASGYEVVFSREKAGLPPLRFRVSRADWTPGRADLAAIGIGVREWAVRPILPGETPGEPTAPRRVVVLPERVDLSLLPFAVDPETGRPLVRWSGGTPGLLYRVDFFPAEGQRPAFSALTPRADYRLPAAAPGVARELRVRVTAIAPGGLVVGQTAIERRRARAQGGALIRASAPAEITGLQPEEGSTVTTDRPEVAAAWAAAVPAAEITLMIDTTDVTPVSEVGETSIVHRPLLPLPAGPHTATLVLSGEARAWNFTVAPDPTEAEAAAGEAPAVTETEAPPEEAAVTAEPSPEEAQEAASASDWGLTVLGTLTVLEGPAPEGPDDARAQTSGQGDLSSPRVGAKFTGDVSIKHELDKPKHTVQESRNWLIELGGGEAPWRQEGRVGYAPPRFLDGAEILTAGLARGAAEARFASPALGVSYYQSFDDAPGGVSAGGFAKQRVRGAAIETPWDPNRFFLRAVGLRVDEQPGELSTGGQGEIWGLFGRWTPGAALSLTFEGARGDFEPRPGSLETAKDGLAGRLSAAGMFGTFQYGLNLRYTDAEFVNPANRGLTAGGVSDQAGGDLSLSQTIGKTTVALQYRHLEGGATSGSTDVDSSEDGANLSVTALLSERVNFLVAGNVTKNEGDADPESFLPETDRRQLGFSGTVNETLGQLALSQTYAYQELRDEIQPLSDQTIHTLTFNAAGSLSPTLQISALASGTRTEAAPSVGRTDQILLSVQPIVSLPSVWVSLQPRAAWTRTENDLMPGSTRSEQYQALLVFAPPWLKSLLSLQLSGDWTRTLTTGQPDPGFDSRFAGTLTLRWGAGQGAVMPEATSLPQGLFPAPEHGTADPVTGKPTPGAPQP